MKTYMVGGAVRDQLLGLPVQDRDYVVVGATPETMMEQGFRPVGKEFPVFLHPQTQEEYALARTERKTAPGYRGFTFHAAPDITLEEDLRRRDLTINAMALDENGELIDPFSGAQDVQQKVLRHVSKAFVEDPVRVLRVARFAARFTDFTIAPETWALMRRMVTSGEVDALVPERVWQELSRGMMEDKPSRMFDVLRDCGALARVLPELDALWGVPQVETTHPEIDAGVHTMMVLDVAAQRQHPLRIRFAALLHDLGKGQTPPKEWPRHRGHESLGIPLVETVCERLRVSNACRDLAVMVAREHGNIRRGIDLGCSAIVKLMERCDAFRRPQRFFDLLDTVECDFYGRGLDSAVEKTFKQREHWKKALDAASHVDTAAIARQQSATPLRIPNTIHTARIKAVRSALKDEAHERALDLLAGFEGD